MKIVLIHNVVRGGILGNCVDHMWVDYGRAVVLVD